MKVSKRGCSRPVHHIGWDKSEHRRKACKRARVTHELSRANEVTGQDTEAERARHTHVLYNAKEWINQDKGKEGAGEWSSPAVECRGGTSQDKERK
jgi:hypothetical protein